MSQALSTGGLEWIDPDTARQALHQSVAPEKGYILKVDLKYPQELHNAHSACPLVPERVEVEPTWMLARLLARTTPRRYGLA